MNRLLKSISVILALACLTTGAFAQRTFPRPKWFTGFEAELSYSQSRLYAAAYDPIYLASFNPRLMRMISSKAALGILASGSYAEQGPISYYAIGAGPIASLYLSDIIKQNVPFLEVYGLYSHYSPSQAVEDYYSSSSRWDTNNNQSDVIYGGTGRIYIPAASSRNVFHAGFNIGLLSRLSPSLGLVTSAGFGLTSTMSRTTPVNGSFPGMVLDVGEQPQGATVTQNGDSGFSIYLRFGLMTFL